MNSAGVLAKIIADKSADVINLKISQVGGLTKARAIRDLAVSAGIPMNVEDTWGGDIVTAAIAHLAHSTPDDYLFCRLVGWSAADASLYAALLLYICFEWC